MMAWIRLGGYGGGGFGRILDKDVSGGGGGWAIFVDSGSSGRFGFVHHTTGTTGQWASPTASIATATWYHVAVTWTGTGTPVLYINGASVTVTTITTPTGSLVADAANDLILGNRIDGARVFDGRIADARIYNRVLSAAEMSTIYASKGRDHIVGSLVRRFPLGPGRPGRAFAHPYVDHTVTSISDSPSITVNVPTNHQDGDLLVLIGFSGGDTSTNVATFATPSGWTSRQTLDLPATATRPHLHVWTRTASSEPGGGYALLLNSQSCPIVAMMIALRGATNSVSGTTGTNTGTSAAPSAPSMTPGANAIVLRIMGFDNSAQILTPSWGMFPTNIRGVQVRTDSNGSENGGGLVVGFEAWNATATGTRTFTIGGSDEWGCITIAFPAGDGIEGAPAKDLSNAQAHAEQVVRVVTELDELELAG